ncbi:MAG: anhydro-N-acetylmuramic acid kinase, partial [Leptolyngbyaceae cyanobacterium MAG.088]|nr:anhydro-N-acetylmuramic acid kinase [Leptolyngbyaceae cyanobacterium MAG.088]
QNSYLRSQLQARLPGITLLTTDDVGLDSSFKEAIAFAILGYWRCHQHPGNLPAVTGACKPCLLGQLYSVDGSVNN